MSEEEAVLIIEPIHTVAISVANLDPREDIIVLPPNQVKEIIHEDQTQHPQELEHREP